MEDFLCILHSSTKLQDKSCKLFTLYQFILTRPALNVGAVILPKLVDLYYWIHHVLQYKVTVETAKLHSMREFLQSFLNQFFPSEAAKRMEQIEDIISNYNCLYI